MPRLVLATLALLLLPALPAAADHVGPCWHEYADAALHGVKRPREAVGVLLDTAYGCTGIDQLCEVMDPCILP